jgi:hypothetical protein
MKFIISESQYKRIILEQEPEWRYETDYNKKFMRDNKPTFIGLGLDDTIDILSGLIDGIPGIGNLVSLGIDLLHTLSYVIRFGLASENEIEKKIEYATLSFITLAGAFIPVGGNTLPVVARKGISAVLRETPDTILLIAKKMGIYNKAVVMIKKSKWKYLWLIVLAKIFGGELAEKLDAVTKKLYTMYNSLEKGSVYYNNVVRLYNCLVELKSDVDTAVQISKGMETQNRPQVK